jgi:ligand-binding sensor domain-containing protein/signal transduction histidine kinase/DNA-binding response OmpR family regulator
VLLVCFGSVIHSSFINAQQSNISFHHLQEGLSNKIVKCILKDHNGFMWFGTWGGLNKYDGTKFVVYEKDPVNPNGLSNGVINTLIEDRKHRIWIGTANGVNIYNPELDNFEYVPILNNKNLFYVRSLYCDRDNNIWIGTAGNGLYKYCQENKQITSFKHRDDDSSSISSNFVSSVVEDNDGNIWVGTRTGLDLLRPDNGQFVHYQSDENDISTLSCNSITAMALGKDGELWIGTSNGLNKMVKNNKSLAFKRYKQGMGRGAISHNAILSLLVDNNGVLWVGTENGGLNSLPYQASEFNCYVNEDGNPESLASNSIWSLYQDNLGIIWVGTYNKGVSVIDANYDKFERLQRNGFRDKTLVNNQVRGFAEDHLGNLWIATDGGGMSYFNTALQKFTNGFNNSQLTNKAVMTVLVDTKNNLWVGTWGGGIDRFSHNGSKIRNYSFDGQVNNGFNNVSVLFVDHGGNLWAGSSGGGLFVYDAPNDLFRPIEDSGRNRHVNKRAFINCIFEDSSHNLWIGTSFGLVCMKQIGENKFSFVEYLYSDKQHSISGFNVLTIFEDRNRNLWMGTDDGLNRFNSTDSTFTVFNKENGLPNNTINGLLEDDDGNLWLSTNNGISKFNPRLGTFYSYTREDGLSSNEFYPRACLKTRDGKFYFGNNNGVNAFYPGRIKVNKTIPPVYITDFRLFNMPVKIGADNSPLKKSIIETKELNLNYLQTSFSFDFVALNYTHSAKNQFVYMLEGFDKEWNNAGTTNTATYTNLDPGKYVFKVKGSNNDGIWNEVPVTLKITIYPPIWKSVWAYLFYLVILTAVIYGFVRLLMIKATQAEKLKIEQFHREKSEELSKMKMNFFTNISHELRTPLSLIISPLEELQASQQFVDDAKGSLALVYKNACKLNSLVDELMDFTKSEENRLKMVVRKEELVAYVRELYSMFADEAQRRHIIYRFVTDKDRLDLWFDRDKLEKIILNLLSNAFKYVTDCGCITLLINCLCDDAESQGHQGVVQISVIDDGSGISEEYLDRVFDRFFQSPETDSKNISGTGIGLALVKNLVELHHGTIEVTSEKWKSTCFTVSLPLGNKHFNRDEIFDNVQTDVLFDNPQMQVAVLPDNHLKKPVVLIVEDNYDLRNYLVSVLSAQCQLLEAGDGEQAYNLAVDKLPDLILSDVNLPVMNGIELCRRIKESITTCHIPVIMLTSNVTVEEKIAGVESGADVYITKPFNVRFLQMTIHKTIESRRKTYQRYSQDVYLIPKEVSSNDSELKFLNQIIEYVETHVMDEDITVENLASHLIMNRGNVYRKIKTLTGQTATEFIRSIRLKMAIKYLEAGELNISEIAFKVGFATPGYFTKCFKAQFGKSPSEFINDRG